jgi:hypothetical protein
MGKKGLFVCIELGKQWESFRFLEPYRKDRSRATKKSVAISRGIGIGRSDKEHLIIDVRGEDVILRINVTFLLAGATYA